MTARLACRTCKRYVNADIVTSGGVACVMHAVCMACTTEMEVDALQERIDEEREQETRH